MSSVGPLHTCWPGLFYQTVIIFNTIIIITIIVVIIIIISVKSGGGQDWTRPQPGPDCLLNVCHQFEGHQPGPVPVAAWKPWRRESHPVLVDLSTSLKKKVRQKWKQVMCRAVRMSRSPALLGSPLMDLWLWWERCVDLLDKFWSDPPMCRTPLGATTSPPTMSKEMMEHMWWDTHESHWTGAGRHWWPSPPSWSASPRSMRAEEQSTRWS